MRRLEALTLCLALTAFACQSTTRRHVVDADPEHRGALLAAVTSLEGRWQMEGAEGEDGESEIVARGLHVSVGSR